MIAWFATMAVFFLSTSSAAQTPTPPSPDAHGNTPLHLAALRNDAGAVDTLLAHGADTNALNSAGASALHYGTGSESIVKALLARDAAVDVVSKDGLSPLMTAVARPDSFAVVQLLIAAGADVNLGRKIGRRGGSSPLATAISGGDHRTIKLLIERGADVNASEGLAPLNSAAFMGDLETARQLLDRGADINGNSTFAGPALNTSLYAGHTEMTKLLIERGADLTVRSPSGHGTPPMVWSGYNDRGDPTIARLLLERGLDPNTANDEGETALSFALKNSPDSPLIKLLREKGAKPPATVRPKAIPANEIPAAPAARETFVRERVQRSIDLLQTGSIAFLDNGFVKTSKCISCHQQTLPGVAFGWARERGLRVDEIVLGRQLHAQLAMIASRAEAARQMTEPVPDAPISVGYNLDALAAVHYTPDDTTAAITHYLLGVQRTDGSWLSFDHRPPMEDGPIIATAWAARAVQTFPPLGRERDATTSLQHARRWLMQQTSRSQNERIFQLLGLAWAGETTDAMRPFAKALIEQQKRDGGWSQLPGLDSDAWATGSALIALNKAGVAVRDRAYQRGAEFLLRTQYADGSWWVRSRTWAFQPHFDGHFPHGKDQWISAGGTAWAAMALLVTLEPVTPVAALPTGQKLVATFLASAEPTTAADLAATSSVTPASGKVDFARDIKPLIERSCAGCHGGEKIRGKFSLATRDALLKGGQSGDPAVVPGRSSESHLIRYISDQVEDLEMPPLDRREKYPALTAIEITRLRAWIDAGASWEK
jgi:ankyrin repeat protein/mono/diheme cytochrome c family protein